MTATPEDPLAHQGASPTPPRGASAYLPPWRRSGPTPPPAAQFPPETATATEAGGPGGYVPPWRRSTSPVEPAPAHETPPARSTSPTTAPASYTPPWRRAAPEPSTAPAPSPQAPTPMPQEPPGGYTPPWRRGNAAEPAVAPAEPSSGLTVAAGPEPAAEPAPSPAPTLPLAAADAPRRGPGNLAPDTALSAVFDEADTTAMSKLGLSTLSDFLHYWPRAWVDRGEYADIDDLLDGQSVTTGFTVESAYTKDFRGTRKMLVVEGVTDHDRALSMTFFNPWEARKVLTRGVHVTVSGTLETFRGKRSLKKPEFELDGDLLARPVKTVYPGKAKISPVWIEKRNDAVVGNTEPLPEHLPEEILTRRAMPDFDSAVRDMHLPETVEDAEAAKNRLAYDEAFATQLVLVARRFGANSAIARPYAHASGGFREIYDAGLPYELTEGQAEAGTRIQASLAASTPMNALLLGDVGSGKTTVAIRALLQVVDAGGQGAFVAPTEVLAEQHYKGLREDLEGVGIRIGLLVGSMTAAEQKATRKDLAEGRIDLIVGTHSVLSKRAKFKQLGLAVIDEQHRFGVEQRDALRTRSEITPHLLVMTATPIPRTIAMTVYGDLDTYELKGVPAGRKPIKSVVVPLQNDSWIDRIWEVFADQIHHGHQIFLVGHLIERAEGQKSAAHGEDDAAVWSEDEDGKIPRPPSLTVYELADLTRSKLPEARVEVLHGKMDAEDKSAVMSRYAAGEIDVLVSTTVIEVGVNVPNATIMAIWDADRFGAAQLHQLRGRVGRGKYDGLCLLVTSAPDEHPSWERLSNVASTLDGYKIAQLDLEQRREGDILGSGQSGKSRMKLLNLTSAQTLIGQAREDAQGVLAADPALRRHPDLVRWLETMLSDEERKAVTRS